MELIVGLLLSKISLQIPHYVIHLSKVNYHIKCSGFSNLMKRSGLANVLQ